MFSRNEIGVVADSFNQMSEELEGCIVDLEQAHTKFRLLLECAPDAIIIADRNGNIKLVNVQTEKLFEYERNDLIEQPFEILIPEQQRRTVAIRYAAQNQTVSGSFEACITVPAVTEVCRRQEAHSPR